MSYASSKVASMLHAALVKLKERVDSDGSYARSVGICSNVEDFLYENYSDPNDDPLDLIVGEVDNARRLMKILWEDWEFYSGNIKFPVPSPKSYKIRSAESLYHKSTNKWVGKYGQLRKDLLQFLITKTEEMIRTEL